MTDEEMRKGLKTAMEVFRGGYEAGFKAANPSAGILLAACKFALTNLENMTTDDFSLAADLPIRKALRAAINKAEGREENTDA